MGETSPYLARRSRRATPRGGAFGDQAGDEFLGDLGGVFLFDGPERGDEGAEAAGEEGVGPAAGGAEALGGGSDLAGVEHHQRSVGFAQFDLPPADLLDREGTVLELDEGTRRGVGREGAVAGEVEERDRRRGRVFEEVPEGLHRSGKSAGAEAGLESAGGGFGEGELEGGIAGMGGDGDQAAGGQAVAHVAMPAADPAGHGVPEGERRMHLAVAVGAHQFPRQVGIVADELEDQRAPVVIVQRPIHGVEFGRGAVPELLAEAFDPGAMLAADEVGELLEENRRFGGRVAAEIDAPVKPRGKPVERRGDHSPVHPPRSGGFEQRDENRQIGRFGHPIDLDGAESGRRRARGVGGTRGSGGKGKGGRPVDGGRGRRVRRGVRHDQPPRGRPGKPAAAPELGHDVDFGAGRDVRAHPARDTRREGIPVAPDHDPAPTAVLEIDRR